MRLTKSGCHSTASRISVSEQFPFDDPGMPSSHRPLKTAQPAGLEEAPPEPGRAMHKVAPTPRQADSISVVLPPSATPATRCIRPGQVHIAGCHAEIDPPFQCTTVSVLKQHVYPLLFDSLQPTQVRDHGIIRPHDYRSHHECCRLASPTCSLQFREDGPRPWSGRTFFRTPISLLPPQQSQRVCFDNSVFSGLAINLQPYRQDRTVSPSEPRCPVFPLVRFVRGRRSEIKETYPTAR